MHSTNSNSKEQQQQHQQQQQQQEELHAPTFLTLTHPAQSMANPACIKKISAAANSISHLLPS
jgi:hypothetical protein